MVMVMVAVCQKWDAGKNGGGWGILQPKTAFAPAPSPLRMFLTPSLTRLTDFWTYAFNLPRKIKYFLIWVNFIIWYRNDKIVLFLLLFQENIKVPSYFVGLTQQFDGNIIIFMLLFQVNCDERFWSGPINFNIYARSPPVN